MSNDPHMHRVRSANLVRGRQVHARLHELAAQLCELKRLRRLFEREAEGATGGSVLRYVQSRV